MNLDNARLAQTLTEQLQLERPPVALAFIDQAPAGVSSSAAAAPSACTFWRRAEQELFYADASAHLECPVGAMTMGFELPADRTGQAEALVGTMVELGYFSMSEVPSLPAVQKPHSGILYGPLERFPLAPDVVLLQTTPRQAMVLAEAAGTAVLDSSDQLEVLGRPACAAVAVAANRAASLLSLGCIGARTYVELPDDRALVVLPTAGLAETVDRLPTLTAANRALAQHHADQKAKYPR
jgi:uncharacterized protein (DUF169 family)